MDENITDGLKYFRKAMKLENYNIYSSTVIDKLSELYLNYKLTSEECDMLEELGFYNSTGDADVDPYSVKANSCPNKIIKSIENFCDLYNIEFTKSAFKSKLKEVYSCYQSVLNGDEIESIFKDLGTNRQLQKVNFSKSWTFLKIGMKYTDELASAVLANWYNEGAFSETNRQNSDEFTLDDSDTYTYGIDGIGFGIMQWTLKERKIRFVEIADEMDSGVGNINVQFALFKDEISAGGICESAWKKVKACNDIESYTKAFLYYIENPLDKGLKEQNKRIGVAKIIYNSMSKKG